MPLTRTTLPSVSPNQQDYPDEGSLRTINELNTMQMDLFHLNLPLVGSSTIVELKDIQNDMRFLPNPKIIVLIKDDKHKQQQYNVPYVFSIQEHNSR